MAKLDRFVEASRILESDAATREVLIDIVEAGMGNARDKRYYPPEMLQRDAGVFVGAKMFGNHLSRDEEKKLNGAPRSIWDLTGRIKEAWWEPGGGKHARGSVRGRASIASSRLWDLVEHDPELVEVSINALGPTRPGTAPDGGPAHHVEAIKRCLSVDWVATAGAGGRIAAFVENDMEDDMDPSEITLDWIKKNRPDLVEAIEEELDADLAAAMKVIQSDESGDDGDESEKETPTATAEDEGEGENGEEKESPDEEPAEPEPVAAGAAQEGMVSREEFDAAMTRLQESHKQELRVRDNRIMVQQMLSEAGLAQRSVERLTEEFYDSDAPEKELREAVKKAIRDKKAEIAEYKRRGVQGLGDSKETLRESDTGGRSRSGNAHTRLMADLGMKEE